MKFSKVMSKLFMFGFCPFLLISCGGGGLSSGDGWKLDHAILQAQGTPGVVATFRSEDGVGVHYEISTDTLGAEICEDLPYIESYSLSENPKSLVLEHYWPEGCAAAGSLEFHVVLTEIPPEGQVLSFRTGPTDPCIHTLFRDDGSFDRITGSFCNK